jgi:hypothetical protein
VGVGFVRPIPGGIDLLQARARGTRVADIFISYSKQDRERARLLAAFLEAEGYSGLTERGEPHSRQLDLNISTTATIVLDKKFDRGLWHDPDHQPLLR